MAENDYIGALWEKEDRNGYPYFSGEIEIEGTKYSILAFYNKYRYSDKHPHYKIMFANTKKREPLPPPERTTYPPSSPQSQEPSKSTEQDDDSPPF